MGEKFRKIVNAPHKAFGRARKKISEMQPDSKMGKTARVTGIATTGLFQFLLWATKYAALDNHATRAMEKSLGNMSVGKNKKGGDKKLSAFAKKYPNLSSHILYYMMMAGMIAGGNAAYDKYFGNDDEAVRTENVVGIDAEEDIPVYEENTYGAYMARLRPLEPMIIADLIAKEGVRVNKKGEHIPYLDSRGNWTIGFGSTVLKDGTKVTKDTKPITTEEAYELARWHLENETFLLMYWYDIAHDKVNIDTTEEAFAIASIMYNAYANMIETPDKSNINYSERSYLLRKDFAKYGLELPDSVVLKRFAEYPVEHTESLGKLWLNGADKKIIANKIGQFLAGGDGIRWRRWLEAETFMGHITPDILLNCPVNSMFDFFEYVGRDRSNWFLGKDKRRLNTKTINKFKKWIKNPVNQKGESLAGRKKVKDWLPPYARELCESGKCKLGSVDIVPIIPESVAEDVKKQTYVTEYRDAYKAAVTDFRDGNYADAAAKFNKLIENYPDNALLHNDLAATYNELGRYDDAIAHIRIIFDKIGDTEQYGAAYYNAGRAREGMGQLQKALVNYRLAVKHGNRSVRKDVERLSPSTQETEKNKSSVQKKRNKFAKKKVDKRTAYMQATKKLGNHAYTTDFDIQNLNRGGNDMA